MSELTCPTSPVPPHLSHLTCVNSPESQTEETSSPSEETDKLLFLLHVFYLHTTLWRLLLMSLTSSRVDIKTAPPRLPGTLDI